MIPRAFLVASVIGGFAGVSAAAISKNRKEVFRSLTEEPAYLVEGPLVSVVVPALDEKKYLPQLLTSIQNQTYKPIETVVVDQSPAEGYKATQDICWEYGARLIHLPEPNISLARNQGAEAATADMLIFSDADNILAPECVENLVGTLLEGYAIANPVIAVYDDGLYSLGSLWANNWFKTNTLTTCSVAIWKDVFFEVGGYRESCDPMEGCSEDTKLGRDVAQRFGASSMKLVRDALVGTSARRRKKEGLIPTWKSREIRQPLYH
jgi:glycosyltransferase involved in cell wall biosynthesis